MASQDLVEFGTHSGKTFAETIANHRDYALMAIDISSVADVPLDPKAVSFLEYARSMIGNDARYDAGERVVNFGKHKGISYREMVAGHPDYCMYLATRTDDDDTTTESFSDAKEYAGAFIDLLGDGASDFVSSKVDAQVVATRGLPMSERGEMVVSFGKHKGDTFNRVAEKHPDYCLHIYRVATDSSMPNMREFVDYIFDTGIETITQRAISKKRKGSFQDPTQHKRAAPHRP